jgi:hypothetical protein
MATRLVTEALSAATRRQSVYIKTSGLAPRRFDPYPLSHGIIPIATFLHQDAMAFARHGEQRPCRANEEAPSTGPGRHHFVDVHFLPNDFLCGRIRIASQECLQVISANPDSSPVDKFPLRKRANLNQRFARNFIFY